VSRPAAVGAMLMLLALVAVCAALASSTPTRRQLGYGLVKFNGAGPERWALRFRREHLRVLALRAQVRRLRRVVLNDAHVVEAINLAGATFGNSQVLWRKARCETGGTFDPRSRNRGSGAAGLFQFIPSTWSTTPYAVFSPWSPYANALAAGWMHSVGRGNEWVCP
jgi:Transglycosylase-like domain